MIGEKIRVARVTRKWRQSDLAAKIGCTQAYIGILERGECEPGWRIVCRIADIFRMSLDDLRDN